MIILNHNHDDDHITHECAAPPSLCAAEVSADGSVHGIGLPAAYASNGYGERDSI